MVLLFSCRRLFNLLWSVARVGTRGPGRLTAVYLGDAFMSRRRAVLLWSILVLGLSASQSFAEDNWPQWRGPHANGTATSTNLPTTWSATENIVWQAELPAWSGGTPVIWGDRIFVTSPSKPAAAAAAPAESAAMPLPTGLASTAGVFAQQQDQPGRGPADPAAGRTRPLSTQAPSVTASPPIRQARQLPRPASMATSQKCDRPR